ncbi:MULTISPECIES: phosphate acyltransferase PlsX [Clostridium]|uniref:Phosphate acyltransferase n=1 Tax=Clostridium novyi (strain NT) TaxID=386415 RepID=PLSX_CLONN|nr:MULTISPECIES: phosphate acyltransferase PlsX [Clostridium]A0Q0Z2.1 RecName: Full=Phosphate acyltransferase; AltName: Full=Acyl-ACP phosphotransacylase; AltName: Full=Acyl-[acyl-carrier-protein]--phosphate acyltransferase; AltName: Full=Phosphate-acyl-ACP acyltransferase [Clostridium novyi NT]ABK61775.1 fatty acid/phospholipid synthesis protein PlsX [Clostridium novyi NT]KEH88658.1 phosphate acyltransferase [Clostridium novyi A str. NCTC 538]KEH89644.1 phosphate acyltransferase [Clostridium n
MKIVVDGMGGDYSPHIVVKGCIEAIKEYNNIDIIITGPEKLINDELQKYEYNKEKITVLDAKDVITNNEHPVMAIRRKKESSIYKALQMMKNKEADAVISAGSTGAFLAGATLVVGRIKGVSRPALAPIMPGKNGPFMIIDCGANAECKPSNLVQFAKMGEIYFENILNVKNPTVGLINIGSEEEKGNELTKEAHKLLKDMDFNFVGNVEPRDIPTGNTNVLVCDGFVGNTVLKMYEGVASTIFETLKDEIMSSFRTKIGGLLLKPVFKKFKKDYDYKEYGGAAFLGVDGICIKAHGSSDDKAFKNAIKQAINFYENGIIDKIKSHIEQKMI